MTLTDGDGRVVVASFRKARAMFAAWDLEWSGIGTKRRGCKKEWIFGSLIMMAALEGVPMETEVR